MDSNGLGIFSFPRGSVSRLAGASLAVVALTLLGFAGGCTLAPDCDLEDYGAYGGRWQRTLRHSGRVGSVFDPAGAQLPYDGPNAPTEGFDRFPEDDDDAEVDRDTQAAGDGDEETRDSNENRKDAPPTSEPSPNDAPLVPPTELETESPSTADKDRTARRGGLKSVLEPSGPSVR